MKVSGFGIFVLFLYPGAFAEFKEDFTSLSVVQQLKIYCAGSWHNLVLGLFAYLCILLMPTLLFPFYRVADGAVVLHLEKDTILDGVIHRSDIITRLGDCGRMIFSRFNGGRCLR